MEVGETGQAGRNVRLVVEMAAKAGTGVNFINVLRTCFLHTSLFKAKM